MPRSAKIRTNRTKDFQSQKHIAHSSSFALISGFEGLESSDFQVPHFQQFSLYGTLLFSFFQGFAALLFSFFQGFAVQERQYFEPLPVSGNLLRNCMHSLVLARSVPFRSKLVRRLHKLPVAKTA